MSTLIQRLVKYLNEEQYLRPRYKIKDLYVGSIAKLTNREYLYFGVWDDSYNIIKKYAIFYKQKDGTYVHIKSGQKLVELQRAIVGDYCVEDPKSYYKTYISTLRELGETENTKLSKSYIDELETAQNMEWVHGPIPNHILFGS